MAVLAAPPIPTGTGLRGANLLPDANVLSTGVRVVNRPLIAVQTAFAPPASVGYAS